MAESDLPGLIFTYVWAFDEPGDREFIESTKTIFESRGGRAVFVELWSDLETRLARNASPDRLAAKPSKRDIGSSNRRLVEIESTYRLSSGGDFPYPEYLHVDNTETSAREVAQAIAEHFALIGSAT